MRRLLPANRSAFPACLLAVALATAPPAASAAASLSVTNS